MHIIVVGAGSFTQGFLALKPFLVYSDILSKSIYGRFNFFRGALYTYLLICQSLIQVDIFPILQIRALKFRKIKFSPKVPRDGKCHKLVSNKT